MGYLRKKQTKESITDIAILIQKLESFCAYQERCTFEIKARLKELGADTDMSEVVIEHLKEQNFYNDSRFATSYARGKHRIQKWGKSRIIQELKIRQINADLINKAISELDEDEYDMVLFNLLERKLNTLFHRNKENIRQKLINFAYQKGYSYSDIEKSLQLLLNQNG